MWGRKKRRGVGDCIERRVQDALVLRRMQRPYMLGKSAPAGSAHDAALALHRAASRRAAAVAGDGVGPSSPALVQFRGQLEAKVRAADETHHEIGALLTLRDRLEDKRKEIERTRAAMEETREKAAQAAREKARADKAAAAATVEAKKNSPAKPAAADAFGAPGAARPAAIGTPHQQPQQQPAATGAAPPAAAAAPAAAGGAGAGAGAKLSRDEAASLAARFAGPSATASSATARRAAAESLARLGHPRMLSLLTGAGSILVDEKRDDRPLPTPAGRGKEVELFRAWPVCSTTDADDFRRQLQEAVQCPQDHGRVAAIAPELLRNHFHKNSATIKGILLALLPRNGRRAEGNSDVNNRVSAGDVLDMFRQVRQRFPNRADWCPVLDLIIDRSQFLQSKDSVPTDPWRIALQCMLFSCDESPPLGAAYHVARWQRKVNDLLQRVATRTGSAGMDFDPDEDQNPLPAVRELRHLGICLQVHLYSTYQMSRQWKYFKAVANRGTLREGWDVLSAVDFMQVARQVAWSVIAGLLNRIADMAVAAATAPDALERSPASKTGVAALELLCALLRDNAKRVEPRSQRDKQADGATRLEESVRIITLTPPGMFPHLLHEMYGARACAELGAMVGALEARLRAAANMGGKAVFEAEQWDQVVRDSFAAVRAALREAETQEVWRGL